MSSRSPAQPVALGQVRLEADAFALGQRAVEVVRGERRRLHGGMVVGLERRERDAAGVADSACSRG
jgi:hypothetical protein